MRLFIAVQLQKDVVGALCSLQDKLKEMAVKIRFVSPQNLHLTLFFLGNTPESKLAEIRKALQSLSENNSPFVLELNNHLATFDAKNPARLVWIGVKSDLSALQRLQTMIAATMHNIGFLRTEKDYIPHITIARDVHFKEKYLVEKEFANCVFEGKIPVMLMEKITLIESCIENGKRIYKTRDQFDLKLTR